MTLLQSFTMLVKLLSLFLFFVEFFIFVWEAHQYKQMKDLEIIQEPTEEERRHKWAKKGLVFSLSFIALWFGVLILGLAMAQERICVEKQVLENAACVSCSDQNCYSCVKSGSKGCDQCMPGYSYNTDTNKCQACNSNGDV